MASHIRTYLRRERRKWGLSQDELAHLVGLADGTQISRIESGKQQPTIKMLLACQAIFGLTAMQLFPQLTADIDDAILQRAQALFEKLKTDPTLRAKGKRDLLVLSLKRAISRSSHD